MTVKSRIFELLKPVLLWIITLPRRWAYYFYNRKARLLDTPNFMFYEKQAYAWCDGLVIGSGPWLCYLCQKVRRWLTGEKRPHVEKEVNLTFLGQLDNLVVHGHWVIEVKDNTKIKRKPSWMWPTIKWIYPVASYMAVEHHRQMLREMKADMELIKRMKELKMPCSV